MKKLSIMLLAVAAFVVMACQNDTANAVKEAKAVIENAIEKVNKVSNVEEIADVADQFQKDIQEVQKKYPDVKLDDPNAPEVKELVEASKKFMDACRDKANELTGDTSIGDVIESAKEELDNIE